MADEAQLQKVLTGVADNDVLEQIPEKTEEHARRALAICQRSWWVI